MKFEFATAGRIIFGPGSIKQIGALAAGMGRRALVAAGFCVPKKISWKQKHDFLGIFDLIF